MRAITLRFVASMFVATLVVACSRESSETYGFIATLGNDTTSVERITRTGDRIVSDAVGRSPLVVRRHWEATLAPDGSVQRWVMDTHRPNAPDGERDLHHEMELGAGTVRFVRHAGSDTSDVVYTNRYVVTVPWNAFLYGSYELLFDRARSLPDTTQIGQYFFEGWSEGNVGRARVRQVDDNSYTITSTGLSGTGVARLDERGRMASYSGMGTTYKQEVTRVTEVPDIDAIFERFAADEKSHGVAPALSVRDTSRAQLGDVALEIDYSRPLARGRTLVGGLIPYDRVWRTGANAATQLSISAPLMIGNTRLERGTYTLWTLPTEQGVELIVNGQTGQWGTEYQTRHDVARIPLQVENTTSSVEQFTIRVNREDATRGHLRFEWGTFAWSVRVEAKP